MPQGHGKEGEKNSCWRQCIACAPKSEQGNQDLNNNGMGREKEKREISKSDPLLKNADNA